MAHDEDFQRLALLSDCGSKCKPLKELTLSDIMKMPLKHGNRPPLLVDVLRSAMAIGEHAKLVIEVRLPEYFASTRYAVASSKHCVPLARRSSPATRRSSTRS